MLNDPEIVIETFWLRKDHEGGRPSRNGVPSRVLISGSSMDGGVLSVERFSASDGVLWWARMTLLLPSMSDVVGWKRVGE
jgi:hypothetical protein